MIIDSSAIMAVLLGEEHAPRIVLAIDRAKRCRMSAPTRFEVGIVVDRRLDERAARALDELVRGFAIEVVPFDETLAAVARAAYRVYGRGSGHRASLNFGDCFSYALASQLGEPLLFVGDDFDHTDVTAALAG